MTKEEAIKQLEAIPKDGDNEIAHHHADNVLLFLLADLGAVEVVQAFRKARDRAGFWYA